MSANEAVQPHYTVPTMLVGYEARVEISGIRFRLRSESWSEGIRAIVTDIDKDDDVFTEWANDFDDGKRKAGQYLESQFGSCPTIVWTQYVA